MGTKEEVARMMELTKDELMARASDLDIVGRGDMTKSQLARAIAKREGPAVTTPPDQIANASELAAEEVQAAAPAPEQIGPQSIVAARLYEGLQPDTTYCGSVGAMGNVNAHEVTITTDADGTITTDVLEEQRVLEDWFHFPGKEV